MQLTPRYDHGDGRPPLLQIEGDVDPVIPMVRQRRRLGDLLATLDDKQWEARTRCEDWTVKDVIAHLVGTNGFWAMSILQGLQGKPTRLLATFDPVTTPSQLVEPMRALTPAETSAQYLASIAAMEAALDGVTADVRRSTRAESPPGHVSLDALLLHALWDGWIHERDIALPLGLEPVREDDEVAASLLYAAALGPTFLAMNGSTRQATLAIAATDPAVDVTVELGETVTARPSAPADGAAVTLRGPAIDLTEALSFRAPLDAELPAEHRWMLGGLGVMFDRAEAAEPRDSDQMVRE